MDRTNDIIKSINALSVNQAPYQVFSDWIKIVALSIAQTTFFSLKRESDYAETIKKYPADKFAKMAAMLTETCECRFYDVLGDLYMRSGWGNKNTGQFFTPYTLSLACAKLQNYSDTDFVNMNEPAAGAGGMVIATAQAMKMQGIDFQHQLRVIAQDLDLTAFYMCYVQLSLFGINAKIVQGSTLEIMKFKNFDDNVLLTPMFMIDGARW